MTFLEVGGSIFGFFNRSYITSSEPRESILAFYNVFFAAFLAVFRETACNRHSVYELSSPSLSASNLPKKIDRQFLRGPYGFLLPS